MAHNEPTRATGYRLLAKNDRSISYKGHRDYDSFSFDGLTNILDMEINEPRNWQIEANTAVGTRFLNLYSFSCIRTNGEKTEAELLKYFK